MNETAEPIRPNAEQEGLEALQRCLAPIADQRLFVCYRAPADSETGKLKKIPFGRDGAVLTGSFASESMQAQFMTLADALALRDAGRHTGVGIAFYPDCGVVGFDFDRCIGDDCTPSPLQLAALKRLRSHCRERSVSGTGVHVLAIGNAETIKANGVIEAFGDCNFLALTGWDMDRVIAPISHEDVAAIYELVRAAQDERRSLALGDSGSTGRSRSQISSRTDPSWDALVAPARTVPRIDVNAALIEPMEKVLSALHSGPPPKDRDFWMRVVWAAKDGGLLEEPVRAWSRRDVEKYTDEGFDNVWNSTGSGIGVGTLYRWAQQDNGWSWPPADPVAETGPAPASSEVAALNERYAVLRLGADATVLDNHTPVATVAGIVYGPGSLTLTAFRQLLAGQFVRVGDRTVPLAEHWLRHPQRRQYEGAVFAPGEHTPAGILNLYQGWAIQPAAGDVAPWLRLLTYMIPEPVSRDFVTKWLAWKVQNPGAVPGSILVMTGAKGTGKNSLFDPIVRACGPHGAVFDDSEQIAGRFSCHLMTLIFAVLDEAVFAGDPRQMDRIKARVTATTMTYEAKGRDPVAGVNRCAYALLTNHAHVWQATLDERRAVLIEVAETLRGDRAFWDAYYAWLDAGGAGALLQHLLSLDVGEFNPRVIPRTAALGRQIEMTALRDPAAAWWQGVLADGFIGGIALSEHGPTNIDKDALRRSFEGAAGRLARTGDFASAMRKLRVWAGVGGIRQVRMRDGHARSRVVQVPSLLELRAAFSDATGVRSFDDFGDAP